MTIESIKKTKENAIQPLRKQKNTIETIRNTKENTIETQGSNRQHNNINHKETIEKKERNNRNHKETNGRTIEPKGKQRKQ